MMGEKLCVVPVGEKSNLVVNTTSDKRRGIWRVGYILERSHMTWRKRKKR